MRRRFLAALLGSFMAGGTVAQTACPAVPVTLQNGTIADAAEVMADLNAIRDCVNTNAALAGGGLVSGGTPNAQILTLAGVTQYAVGQRIAFKVGAGLTNTGPATLDVNGLGAKAIYSKEGFRLNAGTLVAGRLYELLYDGTNLLALGSGDRVLLWQQAPTNAATVDFTGLDASYAEYIITADLVFPATANTGLQIRLSNGGVFLAGGNYYYVSNDALSPSAPSSTSATSGSLIPICPGTSNTATQSLSMRVAQVTNTATFKTVWGWCTGVLTTGVTGLRTVYGFANNNNAVDGVRLFQNAGNIASGVFRLYGVP